MYCQHTHTHTHQVLCIILPSAWPMVASPFWFMLFFRRCFFLSVSGEEEPTSLVEEELDTPSTAESARGTLTNGVRQNALKASGVQNQPRSKSAAGAWLTDTLAVVGQRGRAPLHPSAASQEERTAQSLHLLHLQEAAGTDWDCRGGNKPCILSLVSWTDTVSFEAVRWNYPRLLLIFMNIYIVCSHWRHQYPDWTHMELWKFYKKKKCIFLQTATLHIKHI